VQTGLMWYDDDPRKTLEAKIEQAAARYLEKYGHAATSCYINPATPAAATSRQGVRILPANTIRPNYLWLGVDEA
jgi:hypothetical protein